MASAALRLFAPGSTRALLFVTIIAPLLIAGTGLMMQSPWTDEIFTLKTAAKQGFWFNINASLGVHVLPVYPAVVYVFSLGGTSLFGARLLSLLAFMGAAFFVQRIARRLFDERVALIAPGLFVIHPLMIWYAQEARMYMLGLFFGLGMVSAALEFFDTGARRELIATCIFALLGLLTHLYFVWVVAALALSSYRRFPTGTDVQASVGDQRYRHAESRRLLAALGLACVLAVPLMLVMIARSSDLHPGFAKTIDVKALGYAALGLAAGSSVGPTIAELHGADPMRAMKPHLPLVGSLLLLFWLPVLLSAYVVWKSKRRAFWLLASLAAIPVLAPFVLSVVTDAVSFNLRYTLIAAPAVLIAVAAAGRAGRWYLLAAVVTVEVFGLAAYYFDTRHWKEDYRGVGEYLRANMPAEAPFYSPEQGNFEYLLGRPREAIVKLDLDALPAIQARTETVYAILMRPWVNDPNGRIRNALESAPGTEKVAFHGFDVYILPRPEG